MLELIDWAAWSGSTIAVVVVAIAAATLVNGIFGAASALLGRMNAWLGAVIGIVLPLIGPIVLGVVAIVQRSTAAAGGAGPVAVPPGAAPLPSGPGEAALGFVPDHRSAPAGAPAPTASPTPPAPAASPWGPAAPAPAPAAPSVAGPAAAGSVGGPWGAAGSAPAAGSIRAGMPMDGGSPFPAAPAPAAPSPSRSPFAARFVPGAGWTGRVRARGIVSAGVVVVCALAIGLGSALSWISVEVQGISVFGASPFGTGIDAAMILSGVVLLLAAWLALVRPTRSGVALAAALGGPWAVFAASFAILLTRVRETLIGFGAADLTVGELLAAIGVDAGDLHVAGVDVAALDLADAATTVTLKVGFGAWLVLAGGVLALAWCLWELPAASRARRPAP